MTKKIISLMILLIMTATLLSGCMYGNVMISVNANGSGTGVAELGFSKEILDHLGKTMNDFTSKKNENYVIKANGMEYIAEKYEDAFTLGKSDAVRLSAGIDMIQNELGPIFLTKIENGFRLTVGLYDEYSPNMKAEHIVNFNNINSLTDSSLTGMTLPDLIAQNAPGLTIKATFNMPYAVTQIDGDSNGVSVNGNTITLDYVKMAKSGTYAWSFDSIKSEEKQQTQPIQSHSAAPAKTDVSKVEPENTAQPAKPATVESNPVQESLAEPAVSSTPAIEVSSSSDQVISSAQESEITVESSFSVSDPPQEDSSIAESVSVGSVEPDINEADSGINYVFIGVIALGIVVAVFVFIYIKQKKNNK